MLQKDVWGSGGIAATSVKLGWVAAYAPATELPQNEDPLPIEIGTAWVSVTFFLHREPIQDILGV